MHIGICHAIPIYSILHFILYSIPFQSVSQHRFIVVFALGTVVELFFIAELWAFNEYFYKSIFSVNTKGQTEKKPEKKMRERERERWIKKNYYRPTNATVLVVFTTYFDCGFVPIGHIIVFVDKMPYVRAILAFLVIVHIERDWLQTIVHVSAFYRMRKFYLNYIDVWLGCIQGNLRINAMKNSACVSIYAISVIWLMFFILHKWITYYSNQPNWQNKCSC